MSEEVARATCDLIAENARLAVDIQAVRAERDQIAQAALDLVNDLTTLRMPDPSRLWQLGGQPLERDYQTLKTLLDQAAQKARS